MTLDDYAKKYYKTNKTDTESAFKDGFAAAIEHLEDQRCFDIFKICVDKVMTKSLLSCIFEDGDRVIKENAYKATQHRIHELYHLLVSAYSHIEDRRTYGKPNNRD